MATMTEEGVSKMMKAKGFFRTPELNEQLYLHFQGFTHIEDLEAFTACKVLWLENNSIQRIENLESMTNLMSLYMQYNDLRGDFTDACAIPTLDSFNCSNNKLSSLRGIHAKFPKVATLCAGNNKIDDEGFAASELPLLPNLSVLEITHNALSDAELVVTELAKLPKLASLKLTGNPLVASTKNYRRWVLSRLTNLKFLDDYPVFPEERRAVTAWAESGFEGEREEKQKIKVEKEAERIAQRDFFNKFCQDIHQSADRLGDRGENTRYFVENNLEDTPENKRVPLRGEFIRNGSGGALTTEDDRRTARQVLDASSRRNTGRRPNEEEDEEEDAEECYMPCDEEYIDVSPPKAHLTTPLSSQSATSSATSPSVPVKKSSRIVVPFCISGGLVKSPGCSSYALPLNEGIRYLEVESLATARLLTAERNATINDNRRVIMEDLIKSRQDGEENSEAKLVPPVTSPPVNKQHVDPLDM